LRKILLVIAGVLVVAILGYMGASKAWGFPIFGFMPSDHGESEAATNLSLINLGQFTTNLADPGRYIKLSVEVEVFSEKAVELTARASEIKTDLYGLLRSRTFDQLSGEDGLRELQAEILSRIEERCPGVARNVFFSEFIVQ